MTFIALYSNQLELYQYNCALSTLDTNNLKFADKSETSPVEFNFNVSKLNKTGTGNKCVSIQLLTGANV